MGGAKGNAQTVKERKRHGVGLGRELIQESKDEFKQNRSPLQICSLWKILFPMGIGSLWEICSPLQF
jgi:hypothetical protein